MPQVTLHSLVTPSQFPVIALVDSSGTVIDPTGVGGVSSVDGQTGAVDLTEEYTSIPTFEAAALDRRSVPAVQGVNIISGYSGNNIAEGSDACTILGGGWSGQVNEITSVMQLATIVGGYDNHISGSVPANPSIIAGGSHNYFSGTATHGFIAGSDNQITALGNATITGGSGNRCSSHFGVISGGLNNTISGVNSSYAVIVGGNANSATALNATVIGGFTNLASNTGATVIGGGENTAAGTYSDARGYQANAQYSRKSAHASGKFATAGDAQESSQVLTQLTTNATVSYMRLDGTAGNTLPLTVPVDGAMMLSILVVARRLTSESGYPSEAKGWDLRNLVTRNETTIAVGTLSSATFGTPTWTADLFVSSNGSVFVRVTGEAAKTIRWVASVRAAEVIA